VTDSILPAELKSFLQSFLIDNLHYSQIHRYNNHCQRASKINSGSLINHSIIFQTNQFNSTKKGGYYVKKIIDPMGYP
jgi:hypothetical protein